MRGLCFGFVWLLLFSGTASAASAYLGMKPPGDTAVVFAPGIVSTGNLHGSLVVSPDGRDLFWTTFKETGGDFLQRIMHVTRTGKSWSAPLPFPPDVAQSSSPVFSPDGKRLYFNITVGQPEAWVVRYAEKTPQGWSEPKEGAAPFNGSASFTRSGRVYYSGALEGKPWNRGIFAADLEGGKLANPLALPPLINSEFIDYTPYVAPDESFLMFSSSRPSTQEDMHLFVSFRDAAGNWSEPRRMDEALGFKEKARFPSLSPDGKLLFFNGDDGNIYWVRSNVIQRLR
jgi:Tol biopolymer transport system component